MKRCIPLEPAAEEVCNQSSVPPLIFQIPPEEGRKRLEDAQNTPVYKYPADINVCQIDTGKWGSIPVYFIAPNDTTPIHNGKYLMTATLTSTKIRLPLQGTVSAVTWQ